MVVSTTFKAPGIRFSIALSSLPNVFLLLTRHIIDPFGAGGGGGGGPLALSPFRPFALSLKPSPEEPESATAPQWGHEGLFGSLRKVQCD